MVIRSNFDNDLKQLKEKLMDMVFLSKTAVEDVVNAIKNTDFELAQKIIDEDYKINELEEHVNNLVIQLIAQQQPVATDLRRIIAGLKISNDVERIGDLAVNMAKSILHIGEVPLIKPIQDLPLMANLAIEMLNKVIKAYYEEDIQLALQTAKEDDQIDRLNGAIIKELLELMSTHPQSLSQITQLAFISRSIERVADHSTNIAEHIIYMVKGKKIDLNA